MKTVGIVGGVGPESTIAYYRLMVAAWRERRPDGSYPSIVINSIDLKKMLDLIGADRLEDVTRFLLEEIQRLARADGRRAGAAAARHDQAARRGGGVTTPGAGG
jgi:aspartate racemase